MPKMHQNTFCGPDPLGEFKRFPRPSSRNLGGPTSKGREGRETQEGANEGGREGKRGKEKEGVREGRGGEGEGRGREGEREGREGKGCAPPNVESCIRQC